MKLYTVVFEAEISLDVYAESEYEAKKRAINTARTDFHENISIETIRDVIRVGEAEE